MGKNKKKIALMWKKKQTTRINTIHWLGWFEKQYPKSAHRKKN